MFYTQIHPDSGDLSGAGHVRFSVFPLWFEKGFEGIYKIVNGTDKKKKGAVIVARLEVNYLAEVYDQSPLTIKTGVARLGKASFTLEQQLIQNEKTVAVAQVTMVNFDYSIKKSISLPDDVRMALGEHSVTDNLNNS
ncbi:acyl-CoA thioesterase [Desulfocicer niacini]